MNIYNYIRFDQNEKKDLFYQQIKENLRFIQK